MEQREFDFDVPVTPAADFEVVLRWVNDRIERSTPGMRMYPARFMTWESVMEMVPYWPDVVIRVKP